MSEGAVELEIVGRLREVEPAKDGAGPGNFAPVRVDGDPGVPMTKQQFESQFPPRASLSHHAQARLDARKAKRGMGHGAWGIALPCFHLFLDLVTPFIILLKYYGEDWERAYCSADVAEWLFVFAWTITGGAILWFLTSLWELRLKFDEQKQGGAVQAQVEAAMAAAAQVVVATVAVAAQVEAAMVVARVQARVQARGRSTSWIRELILQMKGLLPLQKVLWLLLQPLLGFELGWWFVGQTHIWGTESCGDEKYEALTNGTGWEGCVVFPCDGPGCHPDVHCGPSASCCMPKLYDFGRSVIAAYFSTVLVMFIVTLFGLLCCAFCSSSSFQVDALIREYSPTVSNIARGSLVGVVVGIAISS